MDNGINGTEGQGAAATQPSAQTPATQPAGVEMVEKKRLDGALQKIEELTLANRVLTDRLTALTQSESSLRADLTQKESLWNAQQSEFTTKLTTAQTEATDMKSKL